MMEGGRQENNHDILTMMLNGKGPRFTDDEEITAELQHIRAMTDLRQALGKGRGFEADEEEEEDPYDEEDDYEDEEDEEEEGEEVDEEAAARMMMMMDEQEKMYLH